MEEHIAKVRVIEIGGQTQFKEYWDIIIDQDPAHVFFVIDITKIEDMNDLDLFLTFSNGNKFDIQDKLTICTNKIDLPKENHNDLTKYNKFSIIRCSAKNGEGMLDILEQIAKFRNETLPKSILPTKSNSLEKNQNNEETEKIRLIKEKYKEKF